MENTFVCMPMETSYHPFIVHFHYSSYRSQVAFPGVALENVELFPHKWF